MTGPIFLWSDTWQLVINTGTTIVTFLMVFLIQNTQNRDTEALQVKLDELIRVTKGAHLVLLDLEELDDEQLDKVRDTYEKLAAQARADIKSGKDDTGTPDLDVVDAGYAGDGIGATASKCPCSPNDIDHNGPTARMRSRGAISTSIPTPAS